MPRQVSDQQSLELSSSSLDDDERGAPNLPGFAFDGQLAAATLAAIGGGTALLCKYMNKGIKVNAPKSHQMALDHSSINYDSDIFLDEQVIEHPPKRDYNLLGSFEI